MAIRGLDAKFKRIPTMLQSLMHIRTNADGVFSRRSFLRSVAIGSVVASEIGPSEFDLPHFVSIGNRLATIGSGFLGMSVAPFVVGNPEQMPTNVELPRGINSQRFGRRLDLLKDLEHDFSESGGK